MALIAQAERHENRPSLHRLRTLTLGIVALLFLAAAVDGRNAVLDRTSSGTSAADRPVQTLTTGELIREMLTHD